ncbi:unnamed protein product [Microthlaspi erraticum]|uniref:Uncharacterized protein n=1 Tax=Microthlaspi erraticum TaxID=1685480 RepID=A0A6D2JE63_9BRAS|nr:unnamed protein product [Microthlaspi erraticum]
MEVPVINRISDFDVGINDPALSSRAFVVSGVGKLHHAYSFWKWGGLLLIAFLASFTALSTRVKSLVPRLRNHVDVSLPSSALIYDYDSDSDSSCSSDSSDDGEDEDYDDDKEHDLDTYDLRVRGNDDEKVINGNVPWMRRCSGSFGDLISWPDLGGLGSSGVVKLWDHLDVKKEGTVASFLSNCVAASSLSPAVLLAAEKKGSDAVVEVSAWDARAGFGMPALLAEWRQPGRLLRKIVRVNAGDVDKIYVGDYVSGEIMVGDLRMVNDALTELTVSDVVSTVSCRRRR